MIYRSGQDFFYSIENMLELAERIAHFMSDRPGKRPKRAGSRLCDDPLQIAV